ncbi:MAG: hypothetical protein JWO36_1007 [Myxococcales bacterium]|nr:hypothetical protein [Myxococcales bacterium]
MSEERRGSPRHAVSFAGEIETPTGAQKVAITRDVSAAGLLLFTRTRQLTVGEAVKLRVMLGSKEAQVTGRVVRQEPLDVEETTLWRTKVAITLDPSPVFEELMAKVVADAKVAAEKKP